VRRTIGSVDCAKVEAMTLAVTRIMALSQW
jgi:hypothetical protein